MKENRIESFSELETALNNLTSLSQELKVTFGETQSIYEDQDAAWHSQNSMRQTEKMMNYSEEAEKIAKNINEVSEAIQRFKTQTHNIDEQQ